MAYVVACDGTRLVLMPTILALFKYCPRCGRLLAGVVSG